MFNDIKGNWLKQDKLILCSCDEKYFNTYFDRFYNSFKDKWQLPIHIHIIDPSKQSLKWLDDKNISHTWCNTDAYDWPATINKFKIKCTGYKDVDSKIVKFWLYEGYTQCQRFVVLGNNMTASQSVIVADVDAYAQHIPTKKDKEFLFSNTAFSYYKERIMATFCHFHPKDLKIVKEVANSIVNTINKDYFKLGLDQKALTGHFRKFESLDDNWISHLDVRNNKDKLEHSRCLIYHRKGRRGKIGWTDTK